MILGVQPLTALPAKDKVSQDPGHEEAKKAAEGFEAFFVYYLLKVMRETVSKGGLLPSGAGEELYTSLLDEQVAGGIASRGGMGLSEMVLKEISSRQESSPPGALTIAAPHERKMAVLAQPLEPASDPIVDRQAAPPRDPAGFHLPVQGVPSSGYGFRIHPIHHDERFHEGVDIAAKENAPIYPSQAGTVIFSGQKQGYGNVVILEHEGGYRSLYAHNKQNLVEKGQVVSPDRPIATVGQTGVATGPHVHFEIRKDGKPVNPLSLIA